MQKLMCKLLKIVQKSRF